MLKIGTRVAIPNVPFSTFLAAVAFAPPQAHSHADTVLASGDGDACRKEICVPLSRHACAQIYR
jgi:hypothetical protein